MTHVLVMEAVRHEIVVSQEAKVMG